MNRWIAAAAFAVFVGMIVLSNYLLQHFGLLSIGPWLIPAGTACAAITWPARDVLSRACGPRIGPWAGLAAVLVGAGLAYIISPTLAVASAVAYLCSEGVDWGLFWALGGQRSTGVRYLGPLSVSTVVAAFVDSIVFLHLAGFFTWSSFDGLVVAKWATVLVVGLPLAYWLRGAVPTQKELAPA